MNANAKVAKPVTGNSSLMRPRFSPGLLLRDDDLRQGVDYTRDLSRLLFRSLFGCGVVCGLKVDCDYNCEKLIVTVDAGVALDCHGDPIHVPELQSIRIDATCGQELPPELWVVLKRTEKCCAPRSAACSCDDDEMPAVCTRERDCFEIRIVSEWPKCACGCPTSPPPPTVETKPTDQPPPPPAAAQPTIALNRKKPSRPAQIEADMQPTLKTLSANVTTGGTAGGSAPMDCWCADPTSECYRDHYHGICGCECCDCEWLVLAYLKDVSTKEDRLWEVHHSVRRFVRPVLMRDPVAWEEQTKASKSS